MSKCACPGCSAGAKSSCSACGIENYCSSSCQKLDWKIHKSMCPILKKLSNQLQPYSEVLQIIKYVLTSMKGNDVRVLKHLLSYAEFQFGKEVVRKNYRERGGVRISNWIVDMDVLHTINKRLAATYHQNNLLGTTSRDNAVFPHLERSLILLNPWLIDIDSDAVNEIDCLDKDQANYLLMELALIQHNMAVTTMYRNQLDISEKHCQQCLAYSRRLGVEGEKKTTMIFTALKACCCLRERQGNYSCAVTFAEESYNLLVEAYDPVHPQVQEAAGILIDILIRNGDLFDAERYAQITYSNLRDSKNGMDQEGEEVAKGSFNLANVIYRQDGDLIKAEELAREALRIKTLIYYSDHPKVKAYCNILACILTEQNKLGDETKELYERTLAISIKNLGLEAIDTAVGHINIGQFYWKLAGKQSTFNSKRTQLLLAKFHIEEGLRIHSKIYGPNHTQTVDATSLLASVLNEVSKKF